MLLEPLNKSQSDLSTFTYKQCLRKPAVFSLLLPKYASFINIIKRIEAEKEKYDNVFENEIKSVYYPPIGLQSILESVLKKFEVFDIDSMNIIIIVM